MGEKQVVITRPSGKGKPSVQHMASATDDVRRAVETVGWKDLAKLAAALRKAGYEVEVRDFKKGEVES